jgi:hypothetical protein
VVRNYQRSQIRHSRVGWSSPILDPAPTLPEESQGRPTPAHNAVLSCTCSVLSLGRRIERVDGLGSTSLRAGIALLPLKGWSRAPARARSSVEERCASQQC